MRIKAKNLFNVLTAKFGAQPFTPQKRRVAHDDVYFRPGRLHEIAIFIPGEDGVHATDVAQGEQDGVGHVAEAIFVAPLQVADPGGDLRQFVGERVDFDAVQLLWADGEFAGRLGDGRIKALYVMAADPVGDGLLAGRGQLELLVVQELFMTETAALADVVLPAQSWAEREGTFTSGERRVQRYYPAVTAVGASRPDWQILAQVGERVGLGKPAFAASLVFRDISKAVKSYKAMDYRTLAQVVQQWPMVSDEALYYGGTAFENRSGLGQQCPITPPKEPFAVPDVDVTPPDGLALVRAAALYTPGTLNRYSPVIAQRLAQPTLLLHPAEAAKLALAAGEMAQVAARVGVRGTAVAARVQVDEDMPAGVAALRGVPYWPGTAVADIRKSEQ